MIGGRLVFDAWRVVWCTFSGHEIQTVSSLNPTQIRKALACWQWWNYCAGQVPVGKQILRLNLDESAISLFQSGGKGNVFVARSRAVQHAPLAVRRMYLTLVAIVCDDPRIQPVIPQFLIGNERAIPARRLAALRRGLPPNVHLLRRRSAWNNAALCEEIIECLGDALAPYAATHQPMLSFDCARLHVGAGIFNASYRAGLWSVLIPPKETFLLQTLDTHVFVLLKLFLQKAAQDARIRSPNGELDIGSLVSSVCSAIRTILQGRDWSAAFVSNGFGPRQAGLSERVKTQLELTDTPDVGAARPSPEVLRRCFPKTSPVPAAAVWRPFDGPPAAPRVRAPPVALGPASAVEGGGPRRSARLLARAPPPCPKASGASSPSSASVASPLAPPPAKAFGVRLGPPRRR